MPSVLGKRSGFARLQPLSGDTASVATGEPASSRTRQLGDPDRTDYLPCAGVVVAARSMTAATASGFETKAAWLPSASVTVAPARFAMDCWMAGGIILSAVDTM